MSRSGRLYIGSAYAGHLLCFDPGLNALLDLGAINPKAATFPCRMDEDENGRIWIGSYPGADLTVYDPKTGEFTRYGRMSDVDLYNYPLVAPDGKIACLIRQTRPHVVVFDPDTRERYLAGPITFKGQGTLNLERRRDGNLYVITSDYGNFLISGNEGIAVATLPGPHAAADASRRQHVRFFPTPRNRSIVPSASAVPSAASARSNSITRPAVLTSSTFTRARTA